MFSDCLLVDAVTISGSCRRAWLGPFGFQNVLQERKGINHFKFRYRARTLEPPDMAFVWKLLNVLSCLFFFSPFVCSFKPLSSKIYSSALPPLPMPSREPSWPLDAFLGNQLILGTLRTIDYQKDYSELSLLGFEKDKRRI